MNQKLTMTDLLPLLAVVAVLVSTSVTAYFVVDHSYFWDIMAMTFVNHAISLVIGVLFAASFFRIARAIGIAPRT